MARGGVEAGTAAAPSGVGARHARDGAAGDGFIRLRACGAGETKHVEVWFGATGCARDVRLRRRRD